MPWLGQNSHMTPFNTCPACVRVNLPDARICSTCGAELEGSLSDNLAASSEVFIDLSALEGDLDTTPSVHLDVATLQRWFPLPGDSPDEQAPAAQAAEPPPLPREVRPESRQPADPATAAATAKAQRRAQVRRTLLANKKTAAPTGSIDVLVLESDDNAREHLCSLLHVFGFRTHPVNNTMQAISLFMTKRYVAAFVSITFDGSAAPAAHALCGRIKEPTPCAGDVPCALIVVADSGRPVERVRAELAGCDAFLRKPVNRGSVARALEACNVPLPIDSRRS